MDGLGREGCRNKGRIVMQAEISRDRLSLEAAVSHLCQSESGLGFPCTGVIWVLNCCSSPVTLQGMVLVLLGLVGRSFVCLIRSPTIK